MAANSAARGVDVLVEPSLREAGIADERRRVGGSVDVVRHVRARLVDVEAILIVVGPRLARVGPGDEVTGVGPGGNHGAADRRDVDVVTPERVAAGAVGLPVEVAALG